MEYNITIKKHEWVIIIISSEIKTPDNDQGEIVIYQTDDGETKIDVRFVDETVWLTQAQLIELFQSSKANISEHIKNIYEEGELDEASTVRKFRTVQIEGNRTVTRNLETAKSQSIFLPKRTVKRRISFITV